MDRTLGDNYIEVDGKRQFTDGPPGTTIDADFMNQLQEEILTVIANAGLVPDRVDRTQLYQSIIDLGGYSRFYPVLPNWTEQSNPKNIWLYDICWHGSLFVAVGEADGVDSYILTSSDGVTWTERAPAVAKNVPLWGVCWNGSLFVAVGNGDGADAYIVTSPDGVNWTERAPAVAKNVDLRKVIWCDTLGLFVAVGLNDGADAYIVTSPDGVNWTERVNTASDLADVSYNGRVIVAVGTSGSIVVSNDGATWTSLTAPTSNNFYTVINNGEIFVASGVNIIYTSIDGLVWTARYSPRYGYALYRGTWGLFSFVMVGNVDTTEAFILTSPDGITWTEQSLAKEKRLRGACWNGNQFIAVGEADGTDAYIVLGDSILSL